MQVQGHMGDKKVIYVLRIDIWLQDGIMFLEKETFDSLPQNYNWLTLKLHISRHSHCKQL